MNDILIRTSKAAVTMVGTPEQIKEVLSRWTRQYGRDMPLAYILRLHADSHVNEHKAC
ncbi:hypothetical protein [Paenibacillus sp. PK3_47]|uniref:hypothetical protein n=1 Tax=Paenibacillus sp. PK3_47 TaxID=2072642 RepID=UPI00201DCA40|nr:hypothetical protein [Paenibacillus sp. PK3_47]